MTATITPPKKTGTVPADALKFSGPMQFGEHDTTDDMPNVFPVSFFARSAEPIHHVYWGRIVHDFDGMTHDESISIDFNHDTYWSSLGFVNKFDASHAGLKLGGGLISTKRNDDAWDIYHKGKLGFPWKSSIDFTSIDPNELQFQWVDEFETTEVNGGTFEGPGYVVRKWRLIGVAITQRGVDPDANAQFSTQPADAVSVTVFSHEQEPSTMSDAEKKTVTDGPDATTLSLTKPPENEATTVVTTPGTIDSATLTQFSDAFGNEQGMQYLQSGLKFEAAQLQFAEHRVGVAEAQATKAVEERDTLQTQLGEATDKLKQFGDSSGQDSALNADSDDASGGKKATLFSNGRCNRKTQS